MSNKSSHDDQKDHPVAWLGMAALILVFPLLFFLCVYLPIWLGFAGPYTATPY